MLWNQRRSIFATRPTLQGSSKDMNTKFGGRNERKGGLFTACKSSYDLDVRSRTLGKQPKIALDSYENFFDEVDLNDFLRP